MDPTTAQLTSEVTIAEVLQAASTEIAARRIDPAFEFSSLAGVLHNAAAGAAARDRWSAEENTDSLIHSFCTSLNVRPPKPLCRTHHLIFLDLFKNSKVRRLEVALPLDDFLEVDLTEDGPCEIVYGLFPVPDYLLFRVRAPDSVFATIVDFEYVFNICEPFFQALYDGPVRSVELPDPLHVDGQNERARATHLEIGDYATQQPSKEAFVSDFEVQERFISAEDRNMHDEKIGLVLKYHTKTSDSVLDPPVRDPQNCLVM